jgi:23S rRNA pseudouridine1911/1915/1917 synthase
MPSNIIYLKHSVRPHESGLRLDAVVYRILPKLIAQQSASEPIPMSRVALTRLIQERAILLNGLPSKPTILVKANDLITLQLPTIQPVILEARPNIPITLLFENEQFLVIDKPAGILTHPTPANTSDSVAHWVVENYPQLIHIGGDILRPGIVHRLDQETSGLLILAKTARSFEAFKKLFHDRRVYKTYTALVTGHITPTQGTIDTPLARASDRTRQSIVTEKNQTRGTVRSAITHYAVLESFPNNTDLVEIKPRTGRTHQIRVHLASIGHPIIGDHLYGTRGDKKQAATLPRHLLHASHLDFTLFGEKYSFESPLSQDFQQFLKK